MPDPAESRLLGTTSDHPSYNTAPSTLPSTHHTDGGESGWNPHAEEHHHAPPIGKRPVDVNVLKRNMSIAKGFMDISLLTANANQLRSLIAYGDRSSSIYYIILTGLVLSLLLQIATGVLLIVKERFDLNIEDDHEAAELYNNIVVLLVFITLLLNVFVSSLGVSIKTHHQTQNIYPFLQGVVGRSGSTVRTEIPLLRGENSSLSNTATPGAYTTEKFPISTVL